MEKKIFYAENAPKPIGPYSAVTNVGNMFFISGQIPLDVKTGNLPEGIIEQTRLALTHLKSQVESANLTLGNIVKTTVYLDNMENFGKFNEIYTEFFDAPYPSRAVVAVKTLPKNASVEISAIAMK